MSDLAVEASGPSLRDATSPPGGVPPGGCDFGRGCDHTPKGWRWWEQGGMWLPACAIHMNRHSPDGE